MKSGYFLKAMFKPLNLLLLLITLASAGFAGIGALLYDFSLLYVSSAAIAALGATACVGSTSRTMKNREFLLECRQADRLDDLQKLSWECSDLFGSISRKVDKNTKSRMHTVLKLKEELIKYFKSCSEDPIKQTIVEQALKLVIAYFNLAHNYSVRGNENSSQNIKAIEQRINYNNRRIGSLKSYDAVLELTKTVEMDEKLLKSIRDEGHELEKISVRLNYIESTINAFKHRIISTDSSDPEVEEIENIINEATALDNVLNERRKVRL